MEKSTSRFEAFSDGIFGVAITLLALEIRIPEFEGATNALLWHKIIEKWPEYLTFFNSFAVILLIWIGHHKMVERLRAVNQPVILANAAVLLMVVLFPFPTRTVGNFINTPASEAAVAFFAGYAAFIVLTMMLLNALIMRHPKLMISPQENMPWFKSMMRSQVIGMCTYTAACGVAFFAPKLAMCMTFAAWAFWVYIMQEN